MKSTIVVVLCLALGFIGCRFIRTVQYAKSAFRQEELHSVRKPMLIPFTYRKDWIHLRMKIMQNGRSCVGDFLFDSGAFTSLFDSLENVETTSPDAFELPVTGAYGVTSRALRFAENVDIELGELRIRKRRILVDERPKAFPAESVGIVGLDFFQNCIVKVNFEARCLEILPAESVVPDANVIKLKSSKGTKPILENLSLGNLKPMDYLVDLGSQYSIYVQEKDEVALKRVLGDTLLSYAYDNSGLFDASGIKPESNYYTRCSKLFNNEACAEFEIAGVVNPQDKLKLSNLGIGFMRRVFTSVTFDIPRGKFYYQLNHETTPLDRLSRDIYIDDLDSGFYRTGPVLTTSKWYSQGVRPGQIVLRVNGEQPGNYIEARKAGKNVVVSSLTIQTGEGARTLSRNQ